MGPGPPVRNIPTSQGGPAASQGPVPGQGPPAPPVDVPAPAPPGPPSADAPGIPIPEGQVAELEATISAYCQAGRAETGTNQFNQSNPQGALEYARGVMALAQAYSLLTGQKGAKGAGTSKP